MNHDDAVGKLDAFLADELPAGERPEMEHHIASCPDCQALLAPVELDDSVGSPDDDGVRRSVRRAMRRTAVDAAALAVIVILVFGMFSLFILQPLLIGRGDRGQQAARATWEAPMLFNPGVSVTRLRTTPGLLDRTVTSDVGIALGVGTQQLDPMTTSISLFDIDIERVASFDEPAYVSNVLDGLDDGTVVTVHVSLPRPIGEDAAQALAEDPGHDVRITWVGFDVTSSEFPVVGYPVCRSIDTPSNELFGAPSASAGGTTGSAPVDVASAIDSAIDAVGELAGHDEVADALGGDAALRSLSEALTTSRPNVASVVVTGPTPEVGSFLADLGVPDGAVLAVGFYNWGSPVCGR